MEMVLVGPRDAKQFDPHTKLGDLPLEQWLSMHFEFHGPFADENAAHEWVDAQEFDEDRYWAIIPIQQNGAIDQNAA